MKINPNCLPYLVNQVVKITELTQVSEKEILFQKMFQEFAEIDYTKTNPEITGNSFRLIKEHLNIEDPYKEIRKHYNELFLQELDQIEEKIKQSENPFLSTIKHAIIGNVIDFNPTHSINMESIMDWFQSVDTVELRINHSEKIYNDILSARSILYIGDNCGEICLDMLLIKKIKEINPDVKIYFATRGAPVVNDSIEEDAYFVGIDKYATIINNGDDSLGTILSRTSKEFNEIYNCSDIVISKGQANYESLSEEEGNIYFLLMTKCDVIAKDIGVKQKSLICMQRGNNLNQKKNHNQMFKIIEGGFYV